MQHDRSSRMSIAQGVPAETQFVTGEPLSDIPCAALMIGPVEFMSLAMGDMLIVGSELPSDIVTRVDRHQAMQLYLWLGNHLSLKP